MTRAPEALRKDVRGGGLSILVSQSTCRQGEGMFAGGHGDVLD